MCPEIEYNYNILVYKEREIYVPMLLNDNNIVLHF